MMSELFIKLHLLYQLCSCVSALWTNIKVMKMDARTNFVSLFVTDAAFLRNEEEETMT